MNPTNNDQNASQNETDEQWIARIYRGMPESIFNNPELRIQAIQKARNKRELKRRMDETCKKLEAGWIPPKA